MNKPSTSPKNKNGLRLKDPSAFEQKILGRFHSRNDFASSPPKLDSHTVTALLEGVFTWSSYVKATGKLKWADALENWQSYIEETPADEDIFSGLDTYTTALRKKFGGFPVPVFVSDLPEDKQSVAQAADVVTEQLVVRRDVRSPSREEREEVPTIPPGPLLMALESSKKWGIVAFGDPGEGKSTLLRKTMLLLLGDLEAQEPPKSLANKVPIFIELKAMPQTDQRNFQLESYIKDEYLKDLGILEKQRPAMGKFLWQQVELDKAVLLLDGLDECDFPAETAQGISLFGSEKSPIILTCRTMVAKSADVLSQKFHRVQLRPLGDAEIAAYAKGRLGEAEGTRFLEAVKNAPNSYDLARRGICLAMLCFLWNEGVLSVPSVRDDLYEKLLQGEKDSTFRGLLARKIPETRRREETELKRRVLEEAAFWAFFTDANDEKTARPIVPFTEKRLRALIQKHARTRIAWEDFADNREARQELVDDLLEKGGVLKANEDGVLKANEDVTLGFYHLTLMEYLAACFVGREWQKANMGEGSVLGDWLPEFGTTERWVEIAPKELGEDAGKLPQFQHLLFDPRYREFLLLLVGCLGGKGATNEQQRKWEAWWLCSLARHEYLADFALQCLAQCRWEHGETMLPQADWEEGEPQYAVGQLLVNHLHWGHAEHGAKALRYARKRENRESITEELHNLFTEEKFTGGKYDEWRKSSANLLGWLLDESSGSILIEALERFSDNKDIWRVAGALGNFHQSIHAYDIALALIEALDNEDIAVWVADALGNFHQSNRADDIALALIEALDNEDIARSVASALGKFSQEQVLPTIRSKWRNDEAQQVFKRWLDTDKNEQKKWQSFYSSLRDILVKMQLPAAKFLLDDLPDYREKKWNWHIWWTTNTLYELASLAPERVVELENVERL